MDQPELGLGMPVACWATTPIPGQRPCHTALGNIAEGANAGSQVNLKVVPLRNDGFVYTLYYDANKNGQIDSVDQIISATTSLNQLLGSAGLLAQADIQLLLKVQAAPSATEGVVSQADIVVEVSDFNGIHLDNLKNTEKLH